MIRFKFIKNTTRLPSSIMVMLLVCFSTWANAQALFQYYNSQPVLKPEQQHYLSVIQDQLESAPIYFVDLNEEVVLNQSFTVSDPFGATRMYESNKGNRLKSGAYSTFGLTRGEGDYRSHFYIRKGFLRGEFLVDGEVYSIRPIGEKMHVVYNMSDMPSLDCSDHNEDPSPISERPTEPYIDRDVNEEDSESPDRGGSPDCRVRLLCAYTTAVDNLEADIQGYIENLVEYFNDANDNSEVPWHVELARSVEVNYSETESNEGSPTWRSTDLKRLQDPSDGWVDDVPDLRDLYDADMTIMFCDVVMGGSGEIGGQAFEIGATASEAYAVMRYNNSSTTFPHEFAHLHGCRHHDDSNTTPFAYGHGYDYATGGWETLLSKSSCCSRIQNFSNPDVDNGGVPTGTVAYYDNARVMEVTGDDHHDFQSIVTNKSVWQDETVTVDEVSDFQGATTLTNGSSEVEYQSGSTGTFRASSSITLSPGFWARSGTDFTANLESCTNLRLAAPQDELESEEVPEALATGTEMHAYPNPFSQSLTIALTLKEEAQYEIFLMDMYGKTVKQVVSNTMYGEGSHSLQVDVTELAAGLYFLVAQGQEDRIVKRLSRAGR